MARHGGRYSDFLFRFKGVRYQKHYTEHDFGHDEFSRGVSHVQAESVLRGGLRCERRRSDSFVDFGGD